MRFVFMLLLLACATGSQAQSAPDTLTYEGLVLVPAFTIKAGSITSEGDVGGSSISFGLPDTYLLPFDDQAPFRFLPAVSRGIYSWAGHNYTTSFLSPYTTFLRGTQPDSLLRRYPKLETKRRNLGMTNLYPNVEFGGVAQKRQLPMSRYWRPHLHDPYFWLLRVSFRYVAVGSTLVTVPNLSYRPRPNVPFTQRWATMPAPLFLITEVLKVEPPYPEK